MDIYIESSAILAWLFGERAGPEVGTILSRAESSLASDLTLVEVDRALHRGVFLNAISEAAVVDLRTRLAMVARDWHIIHVTSAVIERARQSFPEEPIRTLDALHVASALHAREAVPGLTFLSLDARVRKVAKRLGFEVVPLGR